MVNSNQYDRLKLHLYSLQAVVKEINEELNDITLHNFLLTLYDFEVYMKRKIEPSVKRPKLDLYKPSKFHREKWIVVDENGKVVE